MDSRLRDPQILFRGRGSVPGRIEKRWSMLIQGPRAEEAGNWFPRDELGQDEWLWVWKWSPHYEVEFAGMGEWAFCGLAPRLQQDGSWIFEASAPELSWRMPDGSRFSVIQEDARGILRILEATGEISLFALRHRSEAQQDADVVVNRGKAPDRPLLVKPSRSRVAPSWRDLLGQERRNTGGLDLLPVYLLASEIRMERDVDVERALRRIASLILSCVRGSEFEIRREEGVLFRISTLAPSPPDGKLEEVVAGSEKLGWAIRGSRLSALSSDVQARITMILQSFE